jgi:hypothetical protein
LVVVVVGVALWAYSATASGAYPLRTAIQLDGVAMTGGGAGWAVGNIGGKPNTLLMRADAGRWTILPKPAGLDDMATLQAVAMDSPQDGWLIAQTPLWKHDRYHTFIPGSTLLRYHDAHWRIASQNIPHQLWALTLRTASDGWAVGSDGVVIHWDGAQWQATPLPIDPHNPGGPYLDTIAAPAAGDAWATGMLGAMFHWDGSAWRAIDLPSQLAAHAPQPVDLALLRPTITGLAMTAPRQGWAVGSAQSSNGQATGEILQCSFGQWRIAQILPGVVPHAVALSARGDGWMVGDNGVILRLKGGQWQRQDSPTRDPLRSLSIAPDGQAWAVGWVGRLLRERQGAWSLVGDVTWSRAASAERS